MKKYKSLIVVVLVISLVLSFAACTGKSQKVSGDKVTQAVTDKAGEVVTDKDGSVVTTEIVGEVVTNDDGSTVTEKVTNSNGQTLTTNQNGTIKNVTQVVTQISTNDKTTSTTNSTTNKTTKKSNSTTKKSDTTTKKDSQKTTTSTTTKPTTKPTTTQSTTLKDVERKININVTLPINSNIEDTLIIYVNNKEIKSQTVHLNGDIISVVTSEKYKGKVTVKAKLKGRNLASTTTVAIGKSTANIKLENQSIEGIEGEDD